MKYKIYVKESNEQDQDISEDYWHYEGESDTSENLRDLFLEAAEDAHVNWIYGTDYDWYDEPLNLIAVDELGQMHIASVRIVKSTNYICDGAVKGLK